jgi:predicted ATPase
MNIASNTGEPEQKKIRVVEIIGPAGAGKTTLFNALSNYPEHIQLSSFPNVRRVADAPFFIKYGLQIIPSLLKLSRSNSRQLTWTEFAWLAILKGWPSVLQRKGRKRSQVIVLDQGPVYLLTVLREFGPDSLNSEDAELLWQDLYRRWAATLDLIVSLDAEDKFLMERIHTRDKEHVVKHETVAIVSKFLGRYRRGFDYVLSMLKTETNSLRVLTFDTSIQRPEEIVHRLLVEFSLS